ncbi:MAG: YHS domain-containing protein, partial [Haloferacaceae archaeon]
ARRGDDGAVPDDLAASAVDALGAAGGGDPAAPGGDDGADAVDPVCGMDVDPDAAAATVEHAGTRYHFCSAGCAEAFADEPEGYL